MPNPTPPLRELLDALQQVAEQPLDQATGLPRELYISEEFLRHEEKEIFYRQWVCAGRADSIPEPGDYLTHHLAYQPVIIMRQKSGDITAFSNVCLHRMMRLLESTGKCSRIVCPYHAWTYDISGKLIAAPHMQKTTGFDAKQFALPQVRCEVWKGWVYITLDNNAESISSQLSELDKLICNYRMEDYVHITQKDYEWTGNWKQLVENFVEGYHLPVVHGKTVGEFFPVDDTRFSELPLNPAFTRQTFTKSYGSRIGRAHEDNKTLIDEERITSHLIGVFPSHLYILAPDHLWYISIQPKGTGEIYIRYGAAIAPEVLRGSADREGLFSDITVFLDLVNAEDKTVLEGIYKGANAPLSRPGPLCWLEQQNHEFTQYLARHLCGTLNEPETDN